VVRENSIIMSAAANPLPARQQASPSRVSDGNQPSRVNVLAARQTKNFNLSDLMLRVHHLGHSQSECTVWLCEELGRPYEFLGGDLLPAVGRNRRIHEIVKHGGGRPWLDADHPDTPPPSTGFTRRLCISGVRRDEAMRAAKAM
jgi:hypothetical protein